MISVLEYFLLNIGKNNINPQKSLFDEFCVTILPGAYNFKSIQEMKREKEKQKRGFINNHHHHHHNNNNKDLQFIKLMKV